MYYTIPEGSFSEFSSATSRDLARATSGAIDQIWDLLSHVIHRSPILKGEFMIAMVEYFKFQSIY